MKDRTTAVFFVCGVGLIAAIPHIPSVGSVAGVGTVTAYTALYSYRHTESLGAGDYVTLFRGGLVAYVAGFVPTLPEGVGAYLAAFCFLTAGGLDAVDGAVARKFGTTSLGESLDVEVDGMATLVGSAVGVVHGWLPLAYILVGLARYGFVVGLGVRRVLDMEVSRLSRSITRNGVSVLQTVVIGAALLPVVPETITRPAGLIAMAPFVVWFLRDWAVVCGRYNYTEDTH